MIGHSVAYHWSGKEAHEMFKYQTLGVVLVELFCVCNLQIYRLGVNCRRRIHRIHFLTGNDLHDGFLLRGKVFDM